MLPEVKKNWGGQINTVTVGATQAEGGTRASTVAIGGSATLPFLGFENRYAHPVVAMEVCDSYPEEWPDLLKQPFGNAIEKPGSWARRCLEFGADLICLRLIGCHPEHGNRPPEHAVGAVKEVLQAVPTPLIIMGTGNAEKDNEIFPAVAEAAAGENCLIGSISEKNYKTLVAVSTAYKHKIIAESPCDVNIAKQVNILAQDMGFPVENIVINPSCASLGYGLEYVYSVIERARQAGLKGDRMLAQPIVCDIGIEAWSAKEARVSEQEVPEWGAQRLRAPLWEASTAVAYLMAGADLLILRHPEAVEAIKKFIAELAGTSETGKTVGATA